MTTADRAEPAGGEGWTAWSGGACPLAGNAEVEARQRYGAVVRGRAGGMRWSHDLYVAYGAEDIVAYRRVTA